MPPLRLALIGCGRVTERFHLPVGLACPEVRVTALFDPDVGRAKALATNAPGARVLSRLEEVGDIAEAAIVAAPHHLHADVACDLLDRGIHVLVEKPMALDTGSCDRMLAAAERRGLVLAVGLLRRWYDASRWVKHMLENGDLGPVESVDVREGGRFGWRVASDATFRREMGGGVLSDIGVHVLDLLAWWLGDPQPVAYRDDAMGGVEADCEIELRFPGGSTGFVELSRTRVLRNTIIIRCKLGTLTIGPGFDPEVSLAYKGCAPMLLHGHIDPGGPETKPTLESYFDIQLRDFVNAVNGGQPPFVDGNEGRRSIALLEACREIGTPLEYPWLRPQRDSTVREVAA